MGVRKVESVDSDSCKVTSVSLISGKTNVLVMSISKRILMRQIADWAGGVSLQRAFPTLSCDEREFLKTGITAEEWEALA